MKRKGTSLIKKNAKRQFLWVNKEVCNRHFERAQPLLFNKLGREALEIVAMAIETDVYSWKTYKLDIYGGLKKEWQEMRSEGSI